MQKSFTFPDEKLNWKLKIQIYILPSLEKNETYGLVLYVRQIIFAYQLALEV